MAKNVHSPYSRLFHICILKIYRYLQIIVIGAEKLQSILQQAQKRLKQSTVHLVDIRIL